MKKHEILNQIKDVGLIAVVRGVSSDEAVLIANKIVLGGILGIEITYTTPDATKVIAQLNKAYNEQICLGAGTVLDASSAISAIHAGAKYIVSPHFEQAVALVCNKYHIPYLPGVMTVKEVVNAYEYGVDVVKIFPGGDVGMSFPKSVKGPIPHFNFMPTGGVSIDNMCEWLDMGAFAIGIGGFLTAPAKTSEYDKITAIASEIVNVYNDYKEYKNG